MKRIFIDRWGGALLSLILLSLCIGCGAPSMFDLDAVESAPSNTALNCPVVLYVDDYTRGQIYEHEGYKGQLGAVIAAGSEKMAGSAYSDVTVISSQAEMEGLSKGTLVLTPFISSIERNDGGAGTAWTDVNTVLETRWTLQEKGVGDVWSEKIVGTGVSNKGNMFSLKGNISKGMRRACEDVMQKAYNKMTSADVIKEKCQ